MSVIVTVVTPSWPCEPPVAVVANCYSSELAQRNAGEMEAMPSPRDRATEFTKTLSTSFLPGARQDPLGPLRPPELEHLAQEPAVLFGSNGEGQPVAVGIELRQRDELHVVHAQLSIEAIQLLRLLNVRRAQDAQNVELHLVRLQQLDALDRKSVV